MRTFDIAAIDGVPQGHVAEIGATATVSYGGEAGLQHYFCVHDAINNLAAFRTLELLDLCQACLNCEMHVAIHETWQQGTIAEVDDFSASGRFAVLDAPIPYPQMGWRDYFSGAHIEHPCGFDKDRVVLGIKASSDQTHQTSQHDTHGVP